MAALNYLVDVYLAHSNSAMVFNALLRGILAAGFTMFSLPMYHNLGVDWGTSVRSPISSNMLLFLH